MSGNAEGKMKCPLRMRSFDQPDTCDERCAWLVRLAETFGEPKKTYLVCAMAADTSDHTIVKSPANWIEER